VEISCFLESFQSFATRAKVMGSHHSPSTFVHSQLEEHGTLRQLPLGPCGKIARIPLSKLLYIPSISPCKIRALKIKRQKRIAAFSTKGMKQRTSSVHIQEIYFFGISSLVALWKTLDLFVCRRDRHWTSIITRSIVINNNKPFL